jgi:hypothetical protein
MNPNYAMVAGRAGHRCEYCQAPEAVFNFPFEVEHVVPRALDGSNEIDNLALSCRSCNLHKATTLTAPDTESGCEVALFHPRNHRWSDCFAVDLKTGQIIGKNSIGRATVSALAMNSPLQIAARQLWIRLGLYR